MHTDLKWKRLNILHYCCHQSLAKKGIANHFRSIPVFTCNMNLIFRIHLFYMYYNEFRTHHLMTSKTWAFFSIFFYHFQSSLYYICFRYTIQIYTRSIPDKKKMKCNQSSIHNPNKQIKYINVEFLLSYSIYIC